MDPALASVGAGFLAGGAGQTVANMFRLASSVIKGWSDATTQRSEQDRKDQQLRDEKAASHAGWITSFIFILVVVSGFYGVYYSASQNIPTTVMTEKDPWLNVFGVLRLGGGQLVNTVEGLVLPDYFSRGILMVLGAITGIKAFKYR